MFRWTCARWITAVAMALLVCAVPALAQQQEALDDLRARLDATSFRTLSALLDSARIAGLPSAPLISKAQEGLLKKAQPIAIVAAARNLLARMRVSRDALGTATPSEIEAGASALRAGASSAQLSELRLSRAGRNVAVPLMVVADLLARGVPRDTAARAVQAMITANATDDAFNALRMNIERDISGGMSPAVAAGLRYRALLGRQP